MRGPVLNKLNNEAMNIYNEELREMERRQEEQRMNFQNMSNSADFENEEDEGDDEEAEVKIISNTVDEQRNEWKLKFSKKRKS